MISFTLAMFLIGATADPLPEAATLEVGQNFTLTSEILGEERPWSVYVPENCKEGGENAPCPVLYILDGDSHFHYASGMLQIMSTNSQIPEMIMVAIPNTTDRTRDLTPTHTMLDFEGNEQASNTTSGGGNAFLDFIEKELIPEVDKRFAPMHYRVLSGHSLGGLIALHSFIERPDLFQAYIAVDPSLWWDDLELVRRAEAVLKTRKDIRNKVFITVAEHNPRGEGGATLMETTSERFAYAMEANPSLHLHSGIRQFPGEDHGSVAMPSLYAGLLFVFDGYKNPPPAVTSQGLEPVVAYYRDYLNAYGIELTPPAGVIMDMARVADENGDVETALRYHEYNVAMHPESPMAAFMIAMAYKDAGKKEEAIRYYRRVIELEPTFEPFVKPALEELLKEE
jgi:predicted alpha/beta superfamily hydrolase